MQSSEELMAPSPSRWIKFLRNYGPIPTNDNMYDETIQRALRRHRIDPLVLPAQFLDGLLANFRSEAPISEILTGTAGDGKTYHCREVWRQLGGSETDWNTARKVQRLQLAGPELIVVKDLSELRAEESAILLEQMASDVATPSTVLTIPR
jgi:Cdc6-like AAA superfamily ATPase